MGSLFSPKEHVYCAFCKNSNTVYKSKNLGVKHIFANLFFTLVLMLGFWQGVEPKAIMIFLVLLGVTEIFIHLRWRISLVCRHCGFDPLIYKKSPETAARRVKTFIEQRSKDPRYLLAPSLKLPKIKAKPDMDNGKRSRLSDSGVVVAKPKGKIISRTV